MGGGGRGGGGDGMGGGGDGMGGGGDGKGGSGGEGGEGGEGGSGDGVGDVGVGDDGGRDLLNEAPEVAGVILVRLLWVHGVDAVSIRCYRLPVLAKSQLAFLRDPELVRDAVGVGDTQGGAVGVARGGSVQLEIAVADRGEETQLGPICVVAAFEVAFDAIAAAAEVFIEAGRGRRGRGRRGR
jgi:hypothetical protein